jgi:hypothetical protein
MSLVIKDALKDLLLREYGCYDDSFVENVMNLLVSENEWISVYLQYPPENIQVLAKSPSGMVHLCHWRPAYNIFTCQEKRESSDDWSWKLY